MLVVWCERTNKQEGPKCSVDATMRPLPSCNNRMSSGLAARTGILSESDG